MGDISNKAKSGVKWTTLSTLTKAITSLLKLSILARFLDKEDFGLMALVMFVLGFMMLFMDMGLTAAILFKKDISKNEFSSLYWLNFIFSVFLYVLIYLSAPFIAYFYSEPELTMLIPLAGLILVISSTGRQYKTLDHKNLNFKFPSIFEIIASICSLAVGAILAIYDYGVYSLVYATLIQFLIFNAFLSIRGFTYYGLKLHFNFVETKPFIRVGAYQTGGQIVNYFNRDIDILLIGKFFGADILGGYSLAKQLILRPSQVINPILTKVASPVLAKYQSKTEILKDRYLQLVNIVSTINIPVYLIIAIFAPFFITLLYGSNYLNMTGVVRILSLYMIFRAIGNPVGSLVIATGRTDKEFFWNLLTLILMPLAIFLGSQFSIEVVAVALLLTMVLLFVPSWWFLIQPLTKVTLIEYTKSIIPRPLKLWAFIRKK